jgi:hypothetical protein
MVSRAFLRVSPLLLALGLAPLPARATEWQPPDRLTSNGVEDRTTSGSLFHFWFDEMSAVWMQAQGALGWRLMWSDRVFPGVWTPAAPVEPGLHPDFDPRVSGDSDGRRHVVWQRGTSTASEIMYATGPLGGGWTVEPITTNSTQDMSPDLPDLLDGGGRLHVVWVGFDPVSQSGKVFHAEKTGGAWQVEKLDGSQLGPFWTGAEPRISADYHGIVHVVYRGGDYGDYHCHYARKQNGAWTYQVLFSPNGNDFSLDVASAWGDPVVAMSGNDGWGFPQRIYVRWSTDGGLSFQPAVLASGSFSAVLENVTVVGSEVSGNVYTENAIISRDGPWIPEVLPPANEATQNPSGGQNHAIAALTWPGNLSALYANHGAAGTDSAEVYFISTPPSGGVANRGAPGAAPGVRIRVAPHPVAGGAWIGVEGIDAGAISIYDVAGRLVRVLAGTDRFHWDAADAAGRRVPAGTYYLRIEAGGRSATRPLVVVR